MDSKAIKVQYGKADITFTFGDASLTMDTRERMCQTLQGEAARIAHLEENICRELRQIQHDAERALKKYEDGYTWNSLGEMQSATKVDQMIAAHAQAIHSFKSLWWAMPNKTVAA
jgi:hypothetical protein